MFKIKETESKVTAAKKTLDLKNISVRDLRLVDTDTTFYVCWCLCCIGNSSGKNA